MPIIAVLGSGLLLIVAFLIVTYNMLIKARVRVEQSWKDIDIQLKKRYDLLPDLVETAKKAAALDEKILLEVTKLRSAGMQEAAEGKSPAERSGIESQLSGLLKDIKVQVEAYPDIKAHGELSKLMDNVTDIEEKIAYARQFYNSNVGDFNTKIKVFPAMLIAGMLGFREAEYFEATEIEREDIKVDLSES